MEYNVFFEAVDSISEYQTKLLAELDAKIHFNSCVCTLKCHDHSDHFEDEKYTVINYDICEHNRYADYYDLNKLIPLNQEILISMLPYESTAMKMLVRNTEQDIYTFDEAKRLYLTHLRFWNHMFITHKINYVIQVCVPHHAHDYIIYGLAKVYKCQLMVNEATSVWNHWFPVSDLYSNNEDMQLESKRISESGQEIVLSDYVEHYYQSLLLENKEMASDVVNEGMSRKEHVNFQMKVYRKYFSMPYRIKRMKSLVKKLVINGLCKGKGREIREYWYQIRNEHDFSKRSRIKSHNMRGIRYYDSIATLPKPGETFVVLFLHFQPEATTLPQAGVFVEQELIVELLASALAKRDIILYVKEHFVQPFRLKTFYDDLSHISNVKLIRSDVSSQDLVPNCVATATGNGTIIQESIFNEKPVLTFAHGPFNGAPGTYQCDCEEDILEAIDEIKSGKKISRKDVRAYLKVFDQRVIYTNIYQSNPEGDCKLSPEESIHNMVNGIIQFFHVG